MVKSAVEGQLELSIQVSQLLAVRLNVDITGLINTYLDFFGVFPELSVLLFKLHLQSLHAIGLATLVFVNFELLCRLLLVNLMTEVLHSELGILHALSKVVDFLRL